MRFDETKEALPTLREHALIESAVSSNRLEGVIVDRSRIATVVFGKSLLRDRDEAEVRGYRDALKLIHESSKKLEISEDTIRHLHALARANVGDAGTYKEKDSDIIERSPDGRERIRFKTVAAKDTPRAMNDLVSWPYINFVLFTLKEAYKELEERVGQLKSPRGAKTELILAAIAGLNNDFSVGDLQAKCPGVSVDMVRIVLKKERAAGRVECLGRGRDAKWHRIAKSG